MKQKTKKAIKNLILAAIRKKIKKKKFKSTYMPFFESIFDKKLIYTAGIIQGVYTMFGMSIYEQIAEILCQEAGYSVLKQYKLLGEIDKKTLILIDNILENPRDTKKQEIEEIRKSIKPGRPIRHSSSVVDVFLKKHGKEIYVDIKTVGPNVPLFKSLKRKLLEWAALRFSQKKKAKIDVFIGLPYNPYFPQKYDMRKAKKSCKKADLLIQEELWKKFAGYDVFKELIRTFKKIGPVVKKEIKRYIKNK